MADQVTGNEGGPISNAQAVQWINNFRNNAPQGEITAHLFGINKVNQLLAQPNIKGIRVYYAKGDNNEKKIVIFAVDANGDGLEGYILDLAQPCPPFCGKP